jgi:hypothetical protein
MDKGFLDFLFDMGFLAIGFLGVLFALYGDGGSEGGYGMGIRRRTP